MPGIDALVTDAVDRAPLAGLRGLGRAGYSVLALAPERRGAGLWSRYIRARAVAPDPATDPDGFASTATALAARYGPMVVYPSREETIDALARRGPLPAGLISPWPRLEALERLRDKRALPALAAAAGLATPATLAEGSAGELGSARLPYPCVVKPARVDSPLTEARRVGSDSALRTLLAELPPDAALVVQEWTEGRLAALALVVTADGRIAARFQQVARRIWPAQSGTSAVAVSVRPDEALVEAARRMLAGAGYGGLVQLQFILSVAGPRLIDANPRFYGSLALALGAGLNLPAIWHAATVGRAPAAPPPYRVGVSYHRLSADVTAAWQGAPLRRLRPPAAPRTGAIWAADDPLPSTIVAVASAAGMVGRRLAGRAGAAPEGASGRGSDSETRG